MIALLRENQLDIMLFESGMCAMLVILTMVMKTLPRRKKNILLGMEISSVIMLIADRTAYIYRGVPGNYAYYAVRISNFLVFFLNVLLIEFFTEYLIVIYQEEVMDNTIPDILSATRILCAIAMGLVLISQFSQFYYYFDENNVYHRGPGFIICYVIPLIVILIQLCAILVNYQKSDKLMYISLLLFTIVPLCAALIQLNIYGISFTNMTMVMVVMLLFVFTILDIDQRAKKATEMEVQYLKSEHEKMRIVYEQTTEALSDALDAKDEYTHGHSSRVADYAVKIAKEAGKNEEEIQEIYYAGLLHDVGKIGIPDDIINNPGKLSKIEYDVIKDHPVIGSKILSEITESPYLSMGALYHHERYDGKGYPDGLAGQNIPDIARIIAVADAYDAMTSKRSYRKPLTQAQVREELVRGIGTQFDPQYAKIMIHLVDLDTNFEMQEKFTDESKNRL